MAGAERVGTALAARGVGAGRWVLAFPLGALLWTGCLFSPRDGEVVEDRQTPVVPIVATLAPDEGVQLEVATDRFRLHWEPLGAPFATGSSTWDVRGVPMALGSGAATPIPDAYWFPGPTGHRAYVRASKTASGQGSLASSPDWIGCTNQNPDLNVLELYVACASENSPEAAIHTADFTPPAPPVSGLRVTQNTCYAWPNVRIAWDAPGEAGAVTLYRNGRPVSEGSGQDALRVLPDTPYTYHADWLDDGARSELSRPLTVRTAPCEGPPEIADGDFRVGVFLLRFPEYPDPPVTPSEARAQLFDDPGSVAAYLDEVSRGRAGLSGDVEGWLPFPGGVEDYCTIHPVSGRGYLCNNGQISSDGRAFLAEQGYDLDAYDHIALVVHGTTGAFSLGEVSVYAGFTQASLIHEAIGHSLGRLMHAGSWDCPDDEVGSDLFHPLAGGCFPHRYGDARDPMGSGATQHFHTMNLHLLGWLPEHEIEEAVPGESTWIGKLDSNLPTKQLRIPLQDHAFYFLEFRVAEGFNGLPRGGLGQPETGVQVRLWQDHSFDAQGNRFGDTETLIPEATIRFPLRTGDTFVDPYRGITVRVLEETDDGARVEVIR